MDMQMEWSYVGAVVISGLVIVFVALILLIIAVSLMGKIFDVIKDMKNKKTVQTETVSEINAKSKPAPVEDAVIEEDDSEIIAVIAAAVAAMSEQCGTPLKIRSIKRSRTNAWANAAVNENTRVF